MTLILAIYLKLLLPFRFATKMRDESADTNTEEKRFIFLQLLKIGKLLPIKDDAQWYVYFTFWNEFTISVICDTN